MPGQHQHQQRSSARPTRGRGPNVLENTDPLHQPLVRLVVRTIDLAADAFPDLLELSDGALGQLQDRVYDVMRTFLLQKRIEPRWPRSINRNGSRQLDPYALRLPGSINR